MRYHHAILGSYIILASSAWVGCSRVRAATHRPTGGNAGSGAPAADGDDGSAAIRDETAGGASLAANFQKELERAVAANKGHGGGVFHIANAAGTIWEGAAGLSSGTGSEPMHVEDTFEVASVTKTLTATAIMMLVEDGRLTLDAPLGRLLQSPILDSLLVVGGHNYGRDITVRQLLSHTSGLPDYWYDPPFVHDDTNAFLEAFLADPERLWVPWDMISYIPGLKPIGRPGQTFHYADTNFVLLALIVEGVEGRPLREVFRERIFQPLGMNDTYMSYHEAPVATVTESHRYEDDLDLYHRPQQSADWGGGGLVSSTRDLSRFLFALADGGILRDPQSLTAMQRWIPAGEDGVSYGLGLFGIDLDGSKGKLWGHDGHGNSFMYYWPERGIVFTGTLNQTENDWWPLVAKAIKKLGR